MFKIFVQEIKLIKFLSFRPPRIFYYRLKFCAYALFFIIEFFGYAQNLSFLQEDSRSSSKTRHQKEPQEGGSIFTRKILYRVPFNPNRKN